MNAPPAVDGSAATRMRRALLLLERLHRELAQAVDRVLVTEQLGLAEWMIVAELGDDAAPLTRIARRLARDPSALSRATTRLIRRGLLHSTRHEKDRRRATLRLTAHGLALHERVTAALEDAAQAGGALERLSMERLLSLFPGDGSALPPEAAGRIAAPFPQRHDIHATSRKNGP
jgi:DNA-binding MarR family transcriptional regulator